MKRHRTVHRTWCAALVMAVVALGFLPASATEEPEYVMAEFQFVMLHSVEDYESVGKEGEAEIQQQHLDYLQQLTDEGTALILGPVRGAGSLRGIVVLDAGSTVAAEDIMAEDPWVAAGKLRTEIHGWWAAKDILQPATDIRDAVDAYIGFLERPADAPDYSEEKLADLQAGHMENMSRMHEAGALVIAGPMAGDGELRGLLVFRGEDPGKIKKMVAADPSIKAGRLVLELHDWSVPREAFPEHEAGD